MQTRLCLFCQMQAVVFTTAICTPVGIASVSISTVFLISNGVIKIFLKTMRKKKINTERFIYRTGVNKIT